VFHPVEAALITAGEDHVIKLWNLQKSPAKKYGIIVNRMIISVVAAKIWYLKNVRFLLGHPVMSL